MVKEVKSDFIKAREPTFGGIFKMFLLRRSQAHESRDDKNRSATNSDTLITQFQIKAHRAPSASDHLQLTAIRNTMSTVHDPEIDH